MDFKNKINDLSLKSKIKVLLAILGIVLCVVAICVISVAVYKEYDSYLRLISNTENIVSSDSEKVFYLDFKNVDRLDYEKFYDFLDGLSDIKEIDVSGTFDKSTVSYKELKNNNKYKIVHEKIIKDNPFTNMSSPENTDIIRMSSKIYNLAKIKMDLGEDYNQYNGDEIPILVGYNYKNIVKVGQTFTEEYDKKSYKVIGIMKKNSKWIKNGNLADISSNITSYINLDNYFVAIYNYDDLKNNSIVQIGFDSTYICLKNKGNKDSVNKVNELGEIYELDFNLVNIKEIYEKIEESTSFNMREIVSVLCMIFSVSIIGIIAFVLIIRKIFGGCSN